MPLSDQIRSRRLEKELTMAELARQARVSRGYIHQLETGDDSTRPSADVLYRIAFALGTSVAELLEKDMPGPVEITDISESLRAFALAEQLPDDEIKMLAGIQYRGRRPSNVDDWRFVYESIKRTVERESE
ncbi:MAG: helix-turn-helix domain-containing protein [Chloroflexota bacterium]